MQKVVLLLACILALACAFIPPISHYGGVKAPVRNIPRASSLNKWHSQIANDGTEQLAKVRAPLSHVRDEDISAATTPLEARQERIDPDFFPCLNQTGHCPGYKDPCSPKATAHKHIVRALVKAVHKRYANRVRHYLRSDTTLMIMPANFTITGEDNITDYLAGYNHDMSTTGRYVITDYNITTQLQRDQYVVTLGRVEVKSFFVYVDGHPINITVPFKWDVFFDNKFRIEAIRIYIDTLRYPELQTPPNYPNTTLVDKPRNGKPFDNCIGHVWPCSGYQSPCKTKTNSLLTEETVYLASHLLQEPLYEELVAFLSEDGTSFAPYVESLIEGGPVVASYMLQLNPNYGDSAYTYPWFDPSFIIVEEGYETIISATYLVNWILTQNIVYMTLYWRQVWDLTHRLQFWEIVPDSQMVLGNLLPGTNYANHTVFCEEMETYCVGANSQYPVPSGPYAGYTCEQAVDYNITAMADFGNPSNYPSTTGFYVSCRRFHVDVAKQGIIADGPTSVAASIHCYHAGMIPPPVDNHGVSPCF